MTRAKILVVEDERIIAEDLRDILQNLGYTVPAIVSSGEEAVKKADETHTDLVLMDIRLAGEMDGIETADRIRARLHIPVVYLTAYADEHTLERAKITEPFGYLLKPFKEKELHSTIEMTIYKHKMEMKLKESEERFATTLKSIGDAVISTDMNALVTFMNPAAEALTGWRQEDALGKEVTEVFHILDGVRQTIIENPVIKTIRDEAVPGRVNHHILLEKDGTERLVEYNTAPIKDAKRNITGAVLVFQDLSEREQALATLWESEQKYRTLVENSLQGLVIAQGLPLRFVFANLAVAEVSGYALEEILSFSPEETRALIHPEDQAMFFQHYHHLLEGKPVAPTYEVRIIRKDGSVCSLAMFASRIEYGGKPAMQAALLDMTERKEAQRNLERLNEQLLEEHQQRKILSKRLIDLMEKDRHNVAKDLHDHIGQNLTTLKIDLEEVLAETKGTHPAWHEQIEAARRKAVQVIRDVKSIAHGLMPTLLDTLGLVSSIRAMLDEIKRSTDTEIRFFHRNVPKRVDAEKAVAIYRITQEALSNVIKHAQAKKVFVTLMGRDKTLWLSVEDDGVGFDQEMVTKNKDREAPLGVLIMRERVIQVGGEFTVESKIGQGTYLAAEVPL